MTPAGSALSGSRRGRPGGVSRIRRTAAALVALAAARAAGAHTVEWKNVATFYGDDTEFSTPYRTGETILGAQLSTFLSIRPSEKTEVLAGAFGDHRSGGERFSDPVKPILSFRYHGATSLGVLGTLETRERHGFLEPLEVTTLELTRPIEYGLQWIEDRPRLHADLFIDWQHLNTTTSREIFDYGAVVRVLPVRFVALEMQMHGVHHGGQLHDVGPVANDVAFGPGLRLEAPLPLVAGEAAVRIFELWSSGNKDLAAGGPTIHGHGTWVRGSIAPAGIAELFAIWWAGKDFISAEGDNNYDSVGADPSFYRSNRHYQELGIVKKFPIDRWVDFDGEARLHRIDGTVEASFRLVVRVSLDFPIR
ncbi:MAG TPA: hypothetical protein VG777_07440 [Thermoanaerobaculia bacterium]|nr:hypothetical protein [Thermoanaerobaculia bacterium]